MDRKNLILAILFIITTTLFAQNNRIEGAIYDTENNPIQNATIILQQVDSTFINATTTDSLGVFIFNEKPLNYRFIIQHLLFQTKEINSNSDTPRVIILSEKEYLLDQVVVTAERPIVKVVNGILTYNVEHLTQNKSISNAYEALLKLPGITEQGGGIALTGADKVTIILNGKPSTMSADQLIGLLKQMPVTYVESAEVMYSTPPQYHVRGAAINIVTQKRYNTVSTPTLQGEVNSEYAQRHYASYSAGTSLLYSSKNLSADFLYSYANTQEKTGMDLVSHHNLNSVVHNIEQNNTGDKKRQTHRGRLGLNYKLENNSQLDFVYNAFILTNGTSNELSTGNFSKSNNHKMYEQQMHNLSLDYSSNFGLKVGGNYTYFRNPSTQNFIDNNVSDSKAEFISNSQQKINAVLLYADQTHNLKDNWQLTYGAKFSYANDHDYQTYQTLQGNKPLPNTDNNIKEYIYDLYLGLGKQFSEKLSANISITGEYYELAKSGEWSFFPQAQITYTPSEKHLLQFALSADKQYPSYWEKQNYRSYMNGYVEIHGNPNLKPYNNYSAQLSYINQRKYSFTLYGIYQPNYAMQLAYQASNKLSLIYKTFNWNYNERFGFNINIPFSINTLLNSQVTLNGFYHKAKSDESNEIAFNNEKIIGYAAIDNTFNISSNPNIKLDLSAFYMTKPIQGIYDMSSIYNVDAGIKWIFADKKAELRLKATDIFNSSVPNMHINRSSQYFDMYMYSDSRTIQLSFTYKFGGYKNKERKTIDNSRFGH